MALLSLRSAAFAFAVAAPLALAQGQAPSKRPARQFQLTETRVQVDADGAATVSRRGRPFQALPQTDRLLHLRSGRFDPLSAPPAFAGKLAAPAAGRLFVVQFHTSILPEYRSALEARGLRVVGYLPSNAYLVRGARGTALAAGGEPWVRWVGELPVGCKLGSGALARSIMGRERAALPHEYDLLLAEKHDRAQLVAAIRECGGEVTKPLEGSILLRARLTPAQFDAIAALDSVLWIDAASPIEHDLNNARIQGGANAVEFAAGLVGDGVRVHVTEGLEETHPDWFLPPLVQFDDSGDAHGHCTGMIIGGTGAGNTNARGILPHSQIVEAAVASWGGLSRYAVTAAAIDPAQPFRVMQQTASWGYAPTADYTAAAAELDDVLFDLDLVTTQSQSNTGTTSSRPQAWAKNVISVGGIYHRDTSDPSDDVWRLGALTPASIGPASDGRLKPDVCGYYEGIMCGDLVGVPGYSVTNYNNAFGGTSGATPIVNGFVGLIQQMFTDGMFGNPLPLPATALNRFANKPHMTTVKALLCTTAASYAFSGATDDLTRTHQGWGFPDVARLYDNRDRIVVIDEYEVLSAGEARSWYVWVAPGTPEFRATMTYADPFAMPGAAVHRVNSVDLRVQRFHDGVSWWGNHGLDVGNQSLPGGAANDRDTVENVWLQNPPAGIYTVTVSAPTIVQDGHVETPETDVDFALCIHPVGGGYRVPPSMTIDVVSAAPGDLRVQMASVPATGWTEGFTFISFDTARPIGFGRFFGVESDVITEAVLWQPAVPGDVFHFTNTGGLYPFATFTVDPALALTLHGVRIDAMVTLFSPSGQIVAQSNIDRVTVQ